MKWGVVETADSGRKGRGHGAVAGPQRLERSPSTGAFTSPRRLYTATMWLMAAGLVLLSAYSYLCQRGAAAAAITLTGANGPRAKEHAHASRGRLQTLPVDLVSLHHAACRCWVLLKL